MIQYELRLNSEHEHDEGEVLFYSHTEVAAAAANTLLSGGLETTLELEVVDTLADGLTVGGTPGKSASRPTIRIVLTRSKRSKETDLGAGRFLFPRRTLIR